MYSVNAFKLLEPGPITTMKCVLTVHCSRYILIGQHLRVLTLHEISSKSLINYWKDGYVHGINNYTPHSTK
jgi:hypothetical protein